MIFYCLCWLQPQKEFALGQISIIQQFVGLNRIFPAGFQYHQLHIHQFLQMDVESGLRPAGLFHDLAAGEFLQPQMGKLRQKIPGRYRQVIQIYAQSFRSQLHGLPDIASVYFNVFRVPIETKTGILSVVSRWNFAVVWPSESIASIRIPLESTLQ